MRLCTCIPVPRERNAPFTILHFTLKNGGGYVVIDRNMIVIDFGVRETLSSGVKVTLVAANGFVGWMRPVDLDEVDDERSSSASPEVL